MAANFQVLCDSFRSDLFKSLHAFDTTVTRAAATPNTFYAALYVTSSSLSVLTTQYSVTGEVSGTNYTAGGISVSLATAAVSLANGTANTAGTAFWTPSASIQYVNVTLSTPFDSVLIYNHDLAGKNAVGVWTFGAQTITAGNFTLTMPSNASTTALIRIS